jgi:hypothetical protein
MTRRSRRRLRDREVPRSRAFHITRLEGQDFKTRVRIENCDALL